MRKMILGAAAPILLAMTGTAAVAADGAPWTVSEASGDVRLVDNGKTRAARRGALLASGSIIATGANARAVIVRGKEFVVVSPRSQLRVPLAAESNGGIIQMIADFGTALFKIEKKSTPHFGVRTPYLAAVVKGTTFTVNVGSEGGSVQVTEGAVEVSTLDGGAAELVRPGTVAIIGASDLYRLSLEGGENKVVRSPAAPAEGAVTSSLAPAAQPALHIGPAPEASVIAQAVAEDRLSLSDVTDGLLDGPARADVVLAELSNQGRRVGRGDEDDSAGKPSTQPAPPADPGKSEDKPDLESGSGNGGAGNPDAGKPDTDKPDSDKPDAGKPPVDDGKDKPPVDDGKDKPPVDDGKEKPPADDGKDEPPVDDGKDKPPVDDGKDKPPVDDGKDKPPVDDGKDKPPVDDGKDKPPVDDGKDKPPVDDGKDKPSDTSGGDTAVPPAPPAPEDPAEDLPPPPPPPSTDGGDDAAVPPPPAAEDPAEDLPPPPAPPAGDGDDGSADLPGGDTSAPPPPPPSTEDPADDLPPPPPPPSDDDSSGPGSGDEDDSSGSGSGSGGDDDSDDDSDDDDGLSICVLGICLGSGGDDD
jgi:hypothetical protein